MDGVCPAPHCQAPAHFSFPDIIFICTLLNSPSSIRVFISLLSLQIFYSLFSRSPLWSSFSAFSPRWRPCLCRHRLRSCSLLPAEDDAAANFTESPLGPRPDTRPCLSSDSGRCSMPRPGDGAASAHAYWAPLAPTPGSGPIKIRNPRPDDSNSRLSGQILSDLRYHVTFMKISVSSALKSILRIIIHHHPT